MSAWSPLVQQLLAIVQQKAMVAAVDSTLKFALSALWNLTDETPAAAENFLSCQGLELYEEVLEVRVAMLTTVSLSLASSNRWHFALQSYYGEASIQQKVLGLLVGSACVCACVCVCLLLVNVSCLLFFNLT